MYSRSTNVYSLIAVMAVKQR